METEFGGRLCVVREVYRRYERKYSTGHCRLQVPAEAIKAIGLEVADQYRAAKDPEIDSVIIRKAHTKNWCDKYVLKEAEAVRFELMHVLYLDGSRIGVSAVDYPLSDAELTVEGDEIRMKVPDDLPRVRKISVPQKPKVAHEDRQDIFEIQARYKGTAYALALGASRLGLKDKPVEQDQLITMLRNAGHRLSQLSPRLWKLDDRTVTLPDLMEKARKLDQDLVLIAEAA